MLQPEKFSPSRNFCSWLKIDYSTLLNNIARQCDRSSLIDLAFPMLIRIWPHLEDDLLRAGIEGVLSNDPAALLSSSHALLKILKPGFKTGESGYAREGLLPVLGSFSECLSLSNMAQMLDQRLRFFLRARTAAGGFGAGDWGLDSICEQLGNVPMIDLAGFYLHKQPDPNEISVLRRHLRRLEASPAIMVMPLSSAGIDFKEFRPFISSESLALEPDSKGCFPVETGFWAFPVKSGADYQIFQSDLGSLNGLPGKDFPAQIAGCPARAIEVQADYSEFIISGQYPGPYPVRGYLTGGETHEPIDLRHWNPAELKNLLGHLKQSPVYLQKDNRVIELLP